MNTNDDQVQVQLIKYYDNGYYLGYLMLAHLVIQMHILKILKRIEAILERESKLFPYKERDRKISLEEDTFGTLVGYLNLFVKSDCLFKGGRHSKYDPNNKKKFCQFECCDSRIGGLNKLKELRNDIVHNLVTEKIDIITLEDDIKRSFSKEKIQHIVGLLSNIGLKLSQREGSSDYFTIWEDFNASHTKTPVLNSYGRQIEQNFKLWEFIPF